MKPDEITLKRRNLQVNRELMNCKNGPMEDKVGDNIKRARQVELTRKLVHEELKSFQRE
jgi:hypothetical protein